MRHPGADAGADGASQGVRSQSARLPQDDALPEVAAPLHATRSVVAADCRMVSAKSREFLIGNSAVPFRSRVSCYIYAV